MFTCPICDWRVKIPRDAARPKLEDLQNWQDEIADLPFQPEEEEVLAAIVDKAQGFRDFLGKYTIGSNMPTSIDEMPEMLFYLRKIEGGEVLLALETNVFRQALHTWRPIAPEPPPILDQSLSTRKPRPTKQQKLMKEHGVVKPEDLPPHLRAKTYVRRKTQESFMTGPLLPKPLTESPSAPGSAASPSQSQTAGTGDTPTGMQRQDSVGNSAAGGTFEPGFMSGNIPFNTSFGGNRPASFPPNTPSPMFSPTGDQAPPGMGDPMLPTFSGETPAEATAHDPEFPMFRSNAGMGLDTEDEIHDGLANALASESPSGREGSLPGGEYDNMFMDMTNHDGDASNEPVPGLEQEPSHASEALDMIRTASNGSANDHAEMEDGDHVSKNFDDLFNGDEPN